MVRRLLYKYRERETERSMKPYIRDQLYCSNETFKTKIELDDDALQYVRMAIECGLSILICGENPCLSAAVLNRFIEFIPRNEKSAIVEENMHGICAENLMNNVHLQYGRDREGIRRSFEAALDAHPTWIIADQIKGCEASTLFMSMDFGSSFITTINIKTGGNGLPFCLISRPTSVMADTLSALDISVMVSENANCMLFHEYYWLSRAEIEEGTDLNGKDMFLAKRILPGQASGIAESKVTRDYSRMMGISREEAANELEARKAHKK